MIEQLFLLYGGVIVLSLALSLILYWKVRSPENRNLCVLWSVGLATFILQGVTSQGSDLVVAFGFSGVFFLNLVIAQIGAELSGGRYRRLPYVAGWLLSLPLAAGLAALGSPFWLLSLPVALAIAAPVFVVSIDALTRHRKRLSAMAGLFAVVAILQGLHNLDYPFLRREPDFAALGFTIALLLAFALAITAPASVLERQADDNARLMEASRIRNTFFANVSHELCTPLTLILAPLQELMATPNRPSPELRVLGGIERNAQRLLRFIDELLDLATLDGRGMRLQLEAVDLEDMAKRLVVDSEATASARGLEIIFEADRVDDVWGDPSHLESILTNLLGNALKYGGEGGRVWVRISDLGDSVTVRVADDGPGIAAEHRERIFERFYQAGDGEQGGAGIGLALAKELAEVHGGRLEVESELGEGSAFTLTLRKGREHFADELIADGGGSSPLAVRRQAVRRISSTDARPERVDPGRERARVVVAEDNAELRRYLGKLLGEHYEVFEAADAASAFELVARHHPQLLLSDIMMPGESGVDLCRRIKDDPELRQTPIILLTAATGPEVALDAYGSGADDFVAKPFHPGVLQARVRAQIQLRAMGLRLITQEKLATVGTMAAGLAHELKNPLNSILNAARLLERRPDDAALAARLMPVIADGAARMDGIVSALDVHARPAEEGGARPFDLVEALEATLRLVEHRMADITVHRDSGGRTDALADPGQVNQVLLNLVDNAIRSGARNLWLSIRADGGRVVATVADDGPGVPPKLRERIFDPFFTTREPGQGTGLGLHLSRTIVADQGGQLRCTDREGGGASFELELPNQREKRVADG